LKEKLAQKDKLIDDTSFISSKLHIVDPELFLKFKNELVETWKMIEDQVAKCCIQLHVDILCILSDNN